MFRCKICDGILSSKQEILATYCGHIFHHDCLNHYFITRTTHCPTCRKSLRVDARTAFTVSSGYAIFALDPYERKTSDKIEDDRKDNIKFKDAVLQENIILKSKLTQALQNLLALQAKLNYDDQQRDIMKFHNNTYQDENVRPEGESESFEESLNIEFHAIRNQNVRNSIFKVKEKSNFVTRSRQRKYLTWRNKAQSWLSKMMTACDRLLQSEKGFSPHEYQQQLRVFMNKIYKEGEVVERVKQAATMYLIIADSPDAETNEIENKVIQLTSGLLQMSKRILDKLNELENPFKPIKDRKTESVLNSRSQNLLTYLEKSGNKEISITEEPVYV